MKEILNDMIQSRLMGERLLAVLVDPDKTQVSDLDSLVEIIHQSTVTHIFVGGSEVTGSQAQHVTLKISQLTQLPVVLFPGSIEQICESADALLFLSLISGRNPEYLIGKQVEAVSKLRTSNLEIIPTGYILIENGKETAVQRVSKTEPMSRENIQKIVDTAKAGELLGMKVIYLEAGSGAIHPVNDSIVSNVKKELSVPLIVGGGIKNSEQLDKAYRAGADLVVIGTAFEKNPDFLGFVVKASEENRLTSN